MNFTKRVLLCMGFVSVISDYAYPQMIISLGDFESGYGSWYQTEGYSDILSEQQNSFLRVGGDTAGGLLHGTFTGGEGVYSCRSRIVDVNGLADTDFRFYFQFQDDYNFYVVTMMPSDSDNPNVILGKYSDGNSIMIGQTLIGAMEFNEWFDFKVVRSFCNGRIDVYVNDSLWISRVDHEFQNYGKVGLGSYRTSVDFDNIRFEFLPERTFPFLESSSSRILCLGDTATVWCNYDCDSLLWSDGNTSDTVFVSSFDNIFLSAYVDGCPFNSDTIWFEYSTSPGGVELSDTSVCMGDTLKLFPAYSNLAYNFNWIGFPGIDTIEIVAMESMNYILVTSSINCSSDTYDTINVTVVGELIHGINLPCSISKEQEINFEPLLNDFEDYKEISWRIEDAFVYNSRFPEHTFQESGFSNVSLFVETVGGCVDSLDVGIQVGEDRMVGAVITPNNDGINDRLLFIGNSNSSSCTVYNRWGQIIWSRIGKYKSFDGYNGKGVALPAGTYFYEHRCESVNPMIELIPDIGYVTIIR
ncbi:MAG: gliding motility-associated C-terminal domain-containing protein [Flavobacteriales bacterium]|nr:gliding motility-associated C-terminal domain-containing protein [Flavobacteriales bacterium]